MLLRKLVTSVIITLLLLKLAPSSFADEYNEIKAFVDDTANRVLQVLQLNNDSNIDAVLQQKLTAIFHEVVDINWMARFALGKNWRNLSDTQGGISRIEYLNAYKAYLTNSYVHKFTEYNGHKYTVISVKRLKDGDFIVLTKIFPVGDKTQDSIDVSYRLKKYPNNVPQYKIIDIIGEGISLLAVQRSDFNSVVAKHGIEGLIAMLNSSGKENI